MNKAEVTEQTPDDQSAQTGASSQVSKPVPIEQKWNIPAWMMRDPGSYVDIEDDQFEEEGT